MIETEYCPYCIDNLERDKYLQAFYQDICEHYADTGWPYLLIDNRGVEHLRKLELLGYVVSTECDVHLIDVLPIGYFRSDEKCYFCRDASHSFFN